MSRPPPDYRPFKALGARCDVCPLGPTGLKKHPVPSEIRYGRPLLLGEAPGAQEDEEGRPFVGASGAELGRAFADPETDKTRYDVSIGNVLSCRPGSDNNLRSYLTKLSKKNKTRRKDGLDPIPSPIDCCLQRCFVECRQAPAILALGAVPFAALAGQTGEKKLSGSNGYPLWLRWNTLGDPEVLFRPEPGATPFMATYHPAFVLRRRKWTIPVRRNIAKFFRHAEGRLVDVPSAGIVPRTLAHVEAFLAELVAYGWPIAVDTETERKGDLLSQLYCLGIGTAYRGIVIPFLSVDGHTRYWSAHDEVTLKLMLSKFFALPLKWVGQNFPFDKTVLERHGITPPSRHLDLCVGHHVTRWSELPHDLNHLGSFYLDVQKWKFDEDFKDDRQLWKYNLFDTSREAHLAPIVSQEVRRFCQEDVYRHDMRKQEICRKMHIMGIAADPVEQRRLASIQEAKMAKAQKIANQATGRSGDDELNLASHEQIVKYLFVELGLAVASLDGKDIVTPAGDPSVKREAIEAILDRGVDPKLEQFLYAKLDYGEAQKMLGTFCNGATVGNDGRVHSNWLAHTVPTGRLSSSEPNVQNIPGDLRSMYCAAPGNVFIACDKAQIEGRAYAYMAQDPIFIKAYTSGVDVHAEVNARHMMRIALAVAVTPEQRQAAKTMYYACQYGCTYLKLWRLLRSFYDADEKRAYAGIQLSWVKWCFENWWSQHEAIRKFHKQLELEWRRRGYLESPILKRRRYFLDETSFGGNEDAKAESLYNFPAQSLVADSVDLSTFQVADRLGWDLRRHVGIVHQGHDALTIEVPAVELDKWAKVLKDAMTTTFMGYPLPCDLKVGKRMIADKAASRLAKRALKEGDSVNHAAWLRIAGEAMKAYEVK